MTTIEKLREALHRRKVEFDEKLAGQPLLEHEQRLARWEKFLAEVRPLAVKLAKAELDAQKIVARRVKRVRQLGAGVMLQ